MTALATAHETATPSSAPPDAAPAEVAPGVAAASTRLTSALPHARPEHRPVTAHAPQLAPASIRHPRAAAPPVGAVGGAADGAAPTFGRSPLAAVLLVPSVAVPLCVALYIVAGAPAATPPALALAAAMGAWLLRLRRGARASARTDRLPARERAARPAEAFPAYIAAVVVLIAQATEAWLAHLPAALAILFPAAYPPGVAFDGHRLVATFPLAGSVLFLFGALAYYDRRPVGEGAAWLVFAWAVVSALTPFAYLAAAGARVHYLGGMGVAPLAAAVGVWGLRLLWADARADARAAARPGAGAAADDGLTEAAPAPVASRAPRPPLDRRTLGWAALIAVGVATYATVLYRQAGLLVVGIVCGAMAAGFVVWLRTTARRPADPDVVLPSYLLTLALFMAHVLEEHLTDFAGRIDRAAHVQWAPHDFVLLIVLVGPALWIAGAVGLRYRHPVGNYLAWFMFVGMFLGEPAHVLVFPFLEGGRYHYFPGMWTSLLPLVPAVYGARRVLAAPRAALRGAAPRPMPA